MGDGEQAAVLFPGQGSQAPGMRDVVERWRPDLASLARSEIAEDVFERVGESTALAQPAIFCASLAGWEALRSRFEPSAMAGHSLGEFAALVAARALTAADALRLVAVRGRLMAEADDGGMLAVRVRGGDLPEEDLRNWGLTLANDNAPGQKVLSGPDEAIDAAEADLRERGVSARRLPVAGAFHSPLMEPAVAPFRAALAEVEIGEPRVPVFSCVTAAPFEDVREGLADAIVSPVKWLDVMRALAARGATRFVETGPAGVLTGLVRKSLEAEAEAPAIPGSSGA